MNATSSYNRNALEQATRLGHLLTEKKITCTVAESCTGGLIGATITAIPGSSTWFRGGIIAYSNELKMELLGVPETVITIHGAVSAETVTAMAEGAARLCGTDCAVAVSGIAGPDGGTNEKPVGLVFIGVCNASRTLAFRHIFPGNRENVRQTTVSAALTHLIEVI